MSEVNLENYIDAMRDFEARYPTVTLEMAPVQLLGMIGVMQLGMRHPNIPAGTKAAMKELIDQIAEQVDVPVLRTVIEMGFDLKFDEFGF